MDWQSTDAIDRSIKPQAADRLAAEEAARAAAARRVAALEVRPLYIIIIIGLIH